MAGSTENLESHHERLLYVYDKEWLCRSRCIRLEAFFSISRCHTHLHLGPAICAIV